MLVVRSEIAGITYGSGLEIIEITESRESVYIDREVESIAPSISTIKTTTFHFFSHGMPGYLLIDGQWRNPKQISDWLKDNNKLIGKEHINIYGCNFAKGRKGKQAVSYLETALGVSVAASDDITGVDGDWELEVGNSIAIIKLEDYKYNLQCAGTDGGMEPNDDYDGDGVCNSADVDDDNDNIQDSLETPSNINVTQTIDAIATHSSTFPDSGGASIAIDSISDASGDITYTNPETDPWWQVDLGDAFLIDSIKVFNRTDCCGDRLDDFILEVLDTSGTTVLYTYSHSGSAGVMIPIDSVNTSGGIVRVRLVGASRILSLKEVEIFASRDSDSDGLPNQYDTDSDNDLCPDALEGSGSTLEFGDLNVDGSINDSVTVDGLPSGLGAFDIGSSQNAAIQSVECDACNSLSSLYTDSDLDGIGDLCDIDDDNDGILDVMECDSNSVINGDFIGAAGLTAWSNTGGWYNRGGAEAYVDTLPEGTYDLSQTITVITSSATMSYDLVANDTFPRDAFIEVYVNDVMVDRQSAQAIVSNAVSGKYHREIALNVVVDSTATILFRAIKTSGVGGVDEVGIDNIFVGACDEDGDDIPNYIDIDSDGDGCNDAVEAGHIDANNNGQVDGVSVDADGKVTGAITAYTGITTAVTDISINSACCDVTISGHLDSDGDEISNLCDLDDDNDGILDVMECDSNSVINGDFIGAAGLTAWSNTGGWYNRGGAEAYVDTLPEGTYDLSQTITVITSSATMSYDLVANDTFPRDAFIEVYVNDVLVDRQSAQAIVSNAVSGKYHREIALNVVVDSTATALFRAIKTSGVGGVDEVGIDNIFVGACDEDGDDIPNYIDIDSDGDGCNDAVEAGHIDANNNGQVDGVSVDADGKVSGAATAYTGVTAAVTDISINSACCDVAISGHLDSDGDKISNFCDLDDDNDGILDTDEYICYESEKLLRSMTYSSCNYGACLSTYNILDLDVPNTARIIQNGSSLTTTYYFSRAYSNTVIGFLNIDRYSMTLTDQDGNPVELELLSGSPETSVIGNVLRDADPSTINNGLSADGFMRVLDTISALTVTYAYLPGATNTTDYIYLWIGSEAYCDTNLDTDGDGTPNHLDLDSDGDGCPDAIEVGVPGIMAPIDTIAGPYGSNGLANSIETNDTDTATVTFSFNYKMALRNHISPCIDSDGDNTPDIYDIDDDNDGVLDAVESPDCFYSFADFEGGERSNVVTISTGLLVSSFNKPENLVDGLNGSGTTDYAVAFSSGQNVAGANVFTFEFETAANLTNIYLQYGNDYSHFDGAYAKLQGSNDGTNWIDLNTAIYYDEDNFAGAVLEQGWMSYDKFSVTQNSGNYFYYRITGTYGSIRGNGVSKEVFFELSPDFISSTSPKPTCYNDSDVDTLFNHQDLDSDGDGCFDAYEAGAIDTNIDTISGPYGSNGLANSLENVDADTASINYISTYDFAATDSFNLCLDTDGDNIPDLYDIDDDNDGILDAVESPNCFYENADFVSGDRAHSVTVSTGIPTSESYSYPEKLIDGITAEGGAVGFTHGSGIAGRILYTFEFKIPIKIQTIYLRYAGSYGHFYVGAKVKLQGSGDGITWTDLNTGQTYYGSHEGEVLDQGVMDYHRFSVTKNEAKYSYYRLRGVSGTIYGSGVTDEVFFEMSEDLIPSLNTSKSCTEDFDDDGLYNHQDSDSDGDGCYDAKEVNLIASNIDTIAGPYGDNGFADILQSIDTNTYNGTYNYTYASIDSIDGCLDSDGDGVGDIFDLDDDNDGILDTDEYICYESEKLLRAMTSSSCYYGACLSTYNTLNVDASTTARLSVDATTIAHDFYFSKEHSNVIIGFLNVDGYSQAWTDQDGNPVTLELVSGSPETSVIGNVLSDIDPATIGNGLSADGFMRVLDTVSALTVTYTYLPGALNTTDNIYFWIGREAYCVTNLDTDGDGIPNYLDSDSDDDGCPDVIEAGVPGVMASADTIAGPYGSNGLANSLETNDSDTATVTFDFNYNLALKNHLNLCIDSDEDDTPDIHDIDDDNDGVLDAVESPHCFYNYSDFESGDRTNSVTITTDLYVSGNNKPEKLVDGLSSSTAADYAVQFYSGQDLAGINVFTFEFQTAVNLATIYVHYYNTYSHFKDAYALLEGSNDGKNWTRLNASVRYSYRHTTGYDAFSVTQNGGNYFYYRIRGAFGKIQSSGISKEVTFKMSPDFVSSTSPKPTCDNDIDADSLYNHLDPDSDGDGCFDGVEAGAITSNTDTVAGPYGNNGLANSLEDVDSAFALINYTSTYFYARTDSFAFCLDSDGDSIPDMVDLDDDNDGVSDIIENPDCFYKVSDFQSGDRSQRITASTGFPTSEPYSYPERLIDGKTGHGAEDAAVGFIHSANITGQNLYTFEFKIPIQLKRIYLQYRNNYSHFYVGARVKLRGSNDGVHWYDLNTGYSYYSSSEGVVLDQGIIYYQQFGVSQNEGKYIYYRLEGVSGRIYGGGSTKEVYFELSDDFNTALHPKGACLEDRDGDGIANNLDLDSDGDGCPDAVESGVAGSLIAGGLQNNLVLDTTDHPNAIAEGPYGNNGLANSLESSDSLNANLTYFTLYPGIVLDSSIYACTDYDDDGFYDLADLDDDNDGILDKFELNCYQATASNTSVVSDIGSQLVQGTLSGSNASGADYSVDLSDAEKVLETSAQYDGTGVSYSWDHDTSTFFTSTIVLTPNQITSFDTIRWGPNLMNINDSRYDNNNQDITLSWNPISKGIVHDPSGQLDGLIDGQSIKPGSTITQKNFLYNGTGNWYIEFVLSDIQIDSFKLTTVHASSIAFNKEGYSFTVSTCACDVDGDGVFSHLDLDSDNDGIPDAIEACGDLTLSLENFMLSTVGETLTNGVIDGSGCGLVLDTDGDGTPDFKDLDSDGDRCHDSGEVGSDSLSTLINRDTFINFTPGDVDSFGVVEDMYLIGIVPDNTNWLDHTTCLIHEMHLSKTSNVYDGNSDGHIGAGDTIYYTFELINQSEVVLDSILINDDFVVGVTCPVDSISPTDTISCNAYYRLTQSDVDKGVVYNFAIATSVGPKGEMIKEGSFSLNPWDTTSVGFTADTTSTILPSAPSLKLTKGSYWIDVNMDGITNVGDSIAYTINSENTGNVTLYSVEIWDSLFTPALIRTIDTLQVDEINSSVVKYGFTQVDVDSGRINNIAFSTALSPSGEFVFDTSTSVNLWDTTSVGLPLDTTSIILPSSPILDLTKGSNWIDGNMDGITNVGDSIRYTIYGKNIGNVTLRSVEVWDSLFTPSLVFTKDTLFIGEIDSFVIDYGLTQSDIDRGEIYNIVFSSSISPKREIVLDTSKSINLWDTTSLGIALDTTSTILPSVPSLDLTKGSNWIDVNMDGITNVGDSIAYTIYSENTGNVTLNSLEIWDSLFTPSLVFAKDTLLVGEKDSIVIKYGLTQVDVDRGELDNIVFGASISPQGELVLDTSMSINPWDTTSLGVPLDTTSIILPSAPSFDLTKGSMLIDVNMDEIFSVGDSIAYTIYSENTGNVTLRSVEIIDSLFASALVSTLDTLHVGEVDTLVVKYGLKQVDVDRGEIHNIAFGISINPSGEFVFDTSTSVNLWDTTSVGLPLDTTSIILPSDPSLELTKGSNWIDANMDGVTNVGDSIAYTIYSENSGNVTLHSVEVWDSLFTPSLVFAKDTLLVGEIDSIVIKHGLTQADIDRGEIYNIAFSASISPSEEVVLDTSTSVNPWDTTSTGIELDTTSTLLPSAPTLGLTKGSILIDTNMDGVTNVGDSIVYTIYSENSGNVTLHSVEVWDSLFTPALVYTKDTLFVGVLDSIVLKHVLTQADVDRGELDNIAFGASRNPRGELGFDTSTSLNPWDTTSIGMQTDTTSTIFISIPSLDLTQGSMLIDENMDGVDNVGDSISYTIYSENTGNVTLHTMEIFDSLFSPSFIYTKDTLLVGERDSSVIKYGITQSDLDRGQVRNIAYGASDSPRGDLVLDFSSSINPWDTTLSGMHADTTSTILSSSPSLDLTHSSNWVDVNMDGVVNVGDSIVIMIYSENIGNVTLHSLEVIDSLFSPPLILTIDTLHVGEKDSTVVMYGITQADIDNGEIDNTTYSESISPDGEVHIDTSRSVNPEDTTSIILQSSPSLSLTKGSLLMDVNMDGAANVGDSIVYTIYSENSGNVTLHSVEVIDSLFTPALIFTKDTLHVGEIDSLVIKYGLTQSDIDRGEVDNIAFGASSSLKGELVLDTSTSINPWDTTSIGMQTDTTSTILISIPSLDLTQGSMLIDENMDGVDNVGDSIAYTIYSENTGNVTLHTMEIFDSLYSPSLIYTKETLLVGERDSSVIKYGITQSDLDRGQVRNIAYGASNSPTADLVLDFSSSINPWDTTLSGMHADTTSTILSSSPSLDLTHSSIWVDVNMDGVVNVGDSIVIMIYSENIGNVTLHSLEVIDSLFSPPLILTIDTLHVGEKDSTVVTYGITQADIDNGEIDNTTYSESISPDGEVHIDTSRSVNPEDTTSIILQSSPSLSLTKGSLLMDVNMDGVTNIGDSIAYTIYSENSGNVTLHSVEVIDSLFTPALIFTKDTLHVGEIDSLVIKYGLTQSDIDRGEVDNIAFGASSSLKGELVLDTSTSINPWDTTSIGIQADTTSTILISIPSLDLTQGSMLIDENMDGVDNVGDSISYTIYSENTGNVTLHTMEIFDSLYSPSLIYTKETLLVGERDSSVIKYGITQSDLDRGQVRNIAYGASNSPTGDLVLDFSSSINPWDTTLSGMHADTTSTILSSSPSLDLTHSSIWVDVNMDGVVNVGDSIVIMIYSENIGNVTLHSLEVIDSLFSPPLILTIDTLHVGEKDSTVVTYGITQADIDNGEIDNTTYSESISPDGEVHIDTSRNINPEDTTSIILQSTPSLELSKGSNWIDVNMDGVANVGDSIAYTIYSENTGNVTLHSVEVIDSLFTPALILTIDTLPVGKIDSSVIKYGITQAHVERGQIDNIAYSSSISPKGEVLLDTSKSVNPWDTTSTGILKDTTSIKLLSAPSLSLTKGSMLIDVNMDGVINVGDSIVYTIHSENSGNMTLHSVEVIDSLFTPALIFTRDTLLVGERDSIVMKYGLTQEDINKGKINNIAFGTASSLKGELVLDTSTSINPWDITSDTTSTILSSAPSLSLTKGSNWIDVNMDGVTNVGDSIAYTIYSENKGNVTLHSLEILDSLFTPVLVFTKDTLSVGEIDSIVVNYGLTQMDVDRGKIQNIALGAALSASEEIVLDTSRSVNPWDTTSTGLPMDTTSTILSSSPSLDLTHSSSWIDVNMDGIVNVGDSIVIMIYSENIGNVTLHSLEVIDSLFSPPLILTIDTLHVGEKDSTIVTYGITQADIDNGEIDNTTYSESIGPNGEVHIDTSRSVGDTTSIILSSIPALELGIGSDWIDSNMDGVANVGDSIAYTIYSENSGNVTLHSVEVIDSLFSPALILTIDTLPVGEINSSVFYYGITQADVERGQIDNIAYSSSISPKGEVLLDTSRSVNPWDTTSTGTIIDTTSIILLSSPSLGLTKGSALMDANMDGVTNVGDSITYTIYSENIGNVTLHSVEVIDSLFTPALIFTRDTLLVGEKDSLVMNYGITQADINNGKLDNIAFGTASSLKGVLVLDTSTSINPWDTTSIGMQTDTTSTILLGMPSLNLTQGSMLIDENMDGVDNVGDSIAYTIYSENTGNVTLLTMEVFDSLFSPSLIYTKESLLIGEKDSSVIKYGITQSDIDRGQVHNIALGLSNSATGGHVLDFSTSINPWDTTSSGMQADTTSTILLSSPSLDLTHSSNWVDVNMDGIVNVGDSIVIMIYSENIGNVTLHSLEVIDSLFTPALILTIDTLHVGEKDSTVVTYGITQADLDNGEIDNTTYSESISPDGEVHIDTSRNINPGDTTSIILSSAPSLELFKGSNWIDVNLDGVTNVGDSIAYTIYSENTGNVTLHSVEVLDSLFTPVLIQTIDTLYVGEIDSIVVNYGITQTDINKGVINNIAIGAGKSPSEAIVKDTSDSRNSGDDMGTSQDTTRVFISESPMIEATKSSMLSLGIDGVASVGDTIYYGFVIRNTGNIPLTSITISDPKATMVGCDSTDLQVGNMSNCNGYYVITQSDFDAGIVKSTAEMTAISLNGTIVKGYSDSSNPGDNMGTSQDTTKTYIGAGNPDIELIKYIDGIVDDGDGINSAGDTVLYKFIVRNTGNVTLTDIIVEDSLVSVTGHAIDLSPNTSDSLTFNAKYVLLPIDAVRGFVDNTATVVAKPPLNSGGISELMDISDTGTDIGGNMINNPETAETPSGSGSTDSDSSNDPTPICVVQPLDCPDNLVLPACTTQAEMNAAFENWLLEFKGGGCGTTLEFSSVPFAPDICGGDITVVLVLRDEAGNLLPGFECSSTFSMAHNNNANVCPANWNIVHNSNATNCIAPGYESLPDFEDATGFELGEGCASDVDITVTYRDSLVPADCSLQANGFLDSREVIRIYNFEDACGNINESCPQIITYSMDGCQNLSSFGTIAAKGEVTLDVPSGCNLPMIEVDEAVTGACGYVEYQWMISTQEDSNGMPFIPSSSNIGTTWLVIDGANEATYNPGVINQNTYYVRCARNFSCCNFEESNIVSFRLNPESICPAGGVETIVNKDCDSDISLTSPNDDVVNGEMIKHISNEKIEAENKTMLGSGLSLDGKTGVEIKAGFEVEANSSLEVYTTGCPE